MALKFQIINTGTNLNPPQRNCSRVMKVFWVNYQRRSITVDRQRKSYKAL